MTGRRSRVWAIPLLLAVIAVLLWTINVSQRTGAGLVAILAIFVSALLLVALCTAVPAFLLMRRDRLVADMAPDQLVIAGVSQMDMRLAVHERRPDVRVPAWIAWTASNSGLRLWKGLVRPTSGLELSWDDIDDIDEITLPSGMRSYRALAFRAAFLGRTRSMSFLVQNPRLPVLVMREIEVAGVARQLRAFKQQHAAY